MHVMLQFSQARRTSVEKDTGGNGTNVRYIRTLWNEKGTREPQQGAVACMIPSMEGSRSLNTVATSAVSLFLPRMYHPRTRTVVHLLNRHHDLPFRRGPTSPHNWRLPKQPNPSDVLAGKSITVTMLYPDNKASGRVR